jgi:hypothetical protein
MPIRPRSGNSQWCAKQNRVSIFEIRRSKGGGPRIRVPLLTLRPTRSDAHVSTLKIRWVLLRVL